ncbi:MAG TPA: type II toxin-antitoxin system HigB family toxin [Longimicrobium sp.]
MRIITESRLTAFWREHPDAEEALKVWRAIIRAASYQKPSEVKEQFRSASFIGDRVTVFNICGNKYRLVVTMRYDMQKVFIRYVVTHEEYDDLTDRGAL